jgi:hypothetical protein
LPVIRGSSLTIGAVFQLLQKKIVKLKRLSSLEKAAFRATSSAA